MTPNLTQSTSETQLTQPSNVQPIPIGFAQLANGLTPLALLIVLTFVGKQFIDSLCRLVQAIKAK
jgi:hypothetical protein